MLQSIDHRGLVLDYILAGEASVPGRRWHSSADYARSGRRPYRGGPRYACDAVHCNRSDSASGNAFNVSSTLNHPIAVALEPLIARVINSAEHAVDFSNGWYTLDEERQ